jgi:putative membrane-bound dehydrogenase-like protein
VPEGFVVERVAAPPLVAHPMMAGFDERGRLFVAENAGVNLPFAELVKDPPSSVLMLEDADGDGTFDKRTVFADKLTFPSGALWHRGALYVCSPPGLWRFEDLDGDGVAEKRTEIVTGFGSTGNAADLHGPYLGPEGWLYFCDGRNGHDVVLGDGTRWKGRAACVYRCRTDGSGLEVVFGGGFDNPVEVAFTAEGEPLVNVNIVHAQPFRVDAILYGIEGGNYPYEPAWQELPRTGDFLPSAGDLGWVATSGFMRYRGIGFGAPWSTRYFSTEFNRHRVRAHKVERDGAGFRITHEDFLTCDHPDFHPTDVLEDADGSLLVVDTGGWFRIGCPQSQIAKPDVKGAIYRVRRAKPVGYLPPDPRGLKLKWDGVHSSDLVNRLGDPRRAVRDRVLARLDGTECGDLESLERMGYTLDATWAIARSSPASAAAGLVSAMESGFHSRLVGLRAIGLTGSTPARRIALASLEDGTLPEMREAATALGRLREREAVGPLLDAMAHSEADRFLEHAIVYALIRIADPAATRAGLTHQSSAVRRAALVALDQMPGGGLTADLVTPHLAGDDPALRQTALAIATAHPDWAAQVAGPIRTALAAATRTDEEGQSLRAAIVAFAKAEPVQAVVADVLGDAAANTDARWLVLRAIADAGLTPLPAAWVEPVRAALAGTDEAVVVQTIAAIRATRAEQFQVELLALARDAARPTEFRVAALAAALPRMTSVEPADFRLLLGELAADRAPLARLAQALPDAGPMELPALLLPFERTASAAVGQALVKSLASSKALTSLTPAGLTQALAKYPAEVRQSAEPLLAKISPDLEAQRARLAELEPLLAGGDPSRGQSVFFGKAAACATCHAVKGTGATVGPDLTKIGAIRAGRDLLESVVFPSSSFARGYEPFVVQTTDHRVLAGTLAGEHAGGLVLHTPAEVRVPRSTVKSIRPDKVSIMPQGLDEQLSRGELADLMAFLQSLK